MEYAEQWYMYIIDKSSQFQRSTANLVASSYASIVHSTQQAGVST